VTLIRDKRCVTIAHMPRSARRVAETPEAKALDEVAREFNRVEAQLERLRERLKLRAVEAVRAGMSKAEAGRRAGYSREYVSALVKAADERDGTTAAS
jgi:hypothetical protein